VAVKEILGNSQGFPKVVKETGFCDFLTAAGLCKELDSPCASRPFWV
jgi:hypothetical protein